MSYVDPDIVSPDDDAALDDAEDLDRRFESGEYDPEQVADMVDDFDLDLLTDAILERRAERTLA